MLKKLFKDLNHKLFWPALILLSAIVILNFINADAFIVVVEASKNWVLGIFGGTFSLVALICVFTMFAIYFSPFGNTVIGGKDAKPIMSKYNWFAITLCTTIATGCVFWGFVQPIIHIDAPPAIWGFEPHSAGAITASLATIYLQWSFQPYAIYGLPSLMFAFAYYNMKRPYGIVSAFTPTFGEKLTDKLFIPVNAILMFTVILGIGSSTGQGIYNISGGLGYLFGWDVGPTLWFLIGLAFVLPAIISSITGVLKGIRILSDINVKIYFLILGFFILVGPLGYVLNLGIESFGVYLSTYFEQSLVTGTATGETWARDWLNYNNNAWMASIAIAPVFIGSLAKGRSIKEFIRMNFFYPSLFALGWMTILGANAIYQDINSGLSITAILNEKGAEFIPYKIFDMLPLGGIVTALYIFAVFVSFVTYVDSSLTAMATLATSKTGTLVEVVDKKINPSRTFVKISLGLLLLLVTWALMVYASMDGAKILANLGGLPGLFIEAILIVGAFKIIRNPQKYNYADYGDYDVRKKDTNGVQQGNTELPV